MKKIIIRLICFCVILIGTVCFKAEGILPSQTPQTPYLTPSLKLYNTDIVISPDRPVVGQRTLIGIRVYNRGSVIASRFYINLRISQGNNQVTRSFYVRSLTPGMSTFKSFYFTPHFTGSYRIDAAVDSRYGVYEHSTGVNYTSRYFVVKQSGGVSLGSSLVDLSVNSSEITINPEQPVAGQKIMVGVYIYNIGRSVASNFYVTFRIYHQGKPFLHDNFVPVLQPGRCYYTYFYYTPELSGSYRVDVLVDSRNTVNEIEKNNNAGYMNFTVR